MANGVRRWKLILLAEVLVPVAVIVAALGGTFVSLRLEENDAFCAVCHTQPEVLYYQQANGSQAATLAAFHAHTQKQNVRCIDCHSGSGTFGRVVGLSQGAHDLFAFLSRNYHDPSITTNRISDASCLKCHANVLPDHPVQSFTSIKSHFHEFYPLWHQVDPNAPGCVDCHTSHTTGNAGDSFANNGAMSGLCDRCHRELSGKVPE